MKLYYWPRTRAFTSLWMMEELAEPYELVHVDVRAADHPTEAYKRINPMGKLAGFQDGECAMGETAAILLYVADKFPQKGFAPKPSDPRRGRFLQWLMFPATTMEPVMVEKRRGTPPTTFQSGWGDYDRAMNALESAMKPGAWLLGKDFTAADLYMASALNFGMQFGMIDPRPAFKEFVARAVARPAHERASAIEKREAALAYPGS